MQELPEYWTAKNQNADFKFLAVELSSELRNEVFSFLKNTDYFNKVNPNKSLKTSDTGEFESIISAFLYILVCSGYDSIEKIAAFLGSNDADIFIKSLTVYSSISIFILLNSGYCKIEQLNNFFNNNEVDLPNKFLLEFSEIYLKILSIRGINTLEKIDSFLKFPKGKDFRDPLKLPNMESAVNRMLRAAGCKETVLIFGDYDADGIISTVLLYDFLKKIGINVLCNIPDRANDGYDINLKYINKIKKNNPEITLIVCVDCGSNSCEVKENFYKDYPDLDILVCDHHKITEKSSDTLTDKNRFIVVNPQDQTSEYNFKYLSGAGVTFKFIQAVASRIENKNLIFEKSYLTGLLDLVAISTIADLMPLIDENRMLVKKGLSVLKNTKNPGLMTLLKSVLPDKINSEEEINTYDVGYIIAPRLNAPGRLGDPDKNILENEMYFDHTDDEKSADQSDAQKILDFKVKEKSFNLLTYQQVENTQHIAEINELVDEINQLNEKRKENQAEMLKTILSNKDYDFENIVTRQKIFIEKSDQWSEGLLGIVASDLVKKLNIPVILFKEDKEKYKGSGRSIEDFDLFENLNSVSRYFEKFGGHKMACGLTIKTDHTSIDKKGKICDNYSNFKKEMVKIAKKKLSGHRIEKKYYYDMEIDFSELKPSFTKELKLMEPFGIGNARPVFLIRDCIIKKVNFSKNAKHAILQIRNQGSYKKALIFNINTKTAEDLNKFTVSTPVSLICNIEENKYEKNIYPQASSLQLLILDLFYKIDS